MPERWIDYVALADIRPAKGNPKLHDTDGIARSVASFGFTEPMMLDERTGHLVAGHGRFADLRTRAAAGREPPDGVKVDEQGRWLAPVVRGWSSMNDEHARAYLAASNKLTINGGWDLDLLPELLTEVDAAGLLELTGFSADELAAMLDDSPAQGDGDGGGAGGADESVCRAGDRMQLGAHVLLVGEQALSAADEICRVWQKGCGLTPVRLISADPADGGTPVDFLATA